MRQNRGISHKFVEDIRTDVPILYKIFQTAFPVNQNLLQLLEHGTFGTTIVFQLKQRMTGCEVPEVHSRVDTVPDEPLCVVLNWLVNSPVYGMVTRTSSWRAWMSYLSERTAKSLKLSSLILKLRRVSCEVIQKLRYPCSLVNQPANALTSSIGSRRGIYDQDESGGSVPHCRQRLSIHHLH